MTPYEADLFEVDLRFNVVKDFQHMLVCLDAFKHQFLEDPSPVIWVDELPSHLGLPRASCPKMRALHLFEQLEYLPTQDPREILVCPGLISANEKTMQAIEALNAAKQAFKATLISLKQAKISVNDPWLRDHFEQHLNQREKLTQYTLRKTGLSRLHLKQCYRWIPLLERTPHKVSLTWANTRAITRITPLEAQVRLHKRGQDAGIQIQMEKLASLRADEQLAIVQELAPHLRANISTLVDNEISRKMLKGTVPIFYLFDEGQPLPVFHAPGEKRGKDSSRPVRSDVKLDPEPFLPAIRAHRYL